MKPAVIEINILNIKYFAPIINHHIYGYYKVERISPRIVEGKVRLDLKLSEYSKLSNPVNYGLDHLAAKGFTRTIEEFENDVKQGQIIQKRT